MVAPTIIKVEPRYGVGLWNNVVITIIQGHMDVAGVRSIGDSYDSLAVNYPQGVAGVTVLRADLNVGSKGTNAEAERVMRRLRGKMLHVAVVVENRGFVAQLLRAVIRTLNSVARGTRLSIATDLDEAARVIVPHIVGGGSASAQQLHSELLQAIDNVNRALPAIES